MNKLLPVTLINQIATEHHAVLVDCHSPVLLPRLFADSTHQAWSCCYATLNCVLKVCSVESVQTSPFWQGLQQLFVFDFIASLGRYDRVYDQVNAMTPLNIPRLMVAGSGSVAGSKLGQGGFLLTEYVSGKNIEPHRIDDSHVEQLAHHLAALHQNRETSFGPLFAPQSSANLWGNTLVETLTVLARAQAIDSVVLDSVLVRAAKIQVETFHPIMPDLRWDQFLVTDTGTLCLIDLDAMVWGPRALELVLLEYLLDESQLKLFKGIYTQSHSIPDLDAVREVYRLLLFLMNVLGESDLEAWMGHSMKF
jgi:hypothetical protein